MTVLSCVCNCFWYLSSSAVLSRMNSLSIVGVRLFRLYRYCVRVQSISVLKASMNDQIENCITSLLR